MSATAILVALQKSAERAVSAEFRGGAASRLLRGSLVATLPGLSFQHSSAETMGGGGDIIKGAADGRVKGVGGRQQQQQRAVAAAAAAGGGVGVVRPSSPQEVENEERLSGQNSVGE